MHSVAKKTWVVNFTEAEEIKRLATNGHAFCIYTSGEHLFEIYWRLIGRPHIALARQDNIYRNISDALGRLRSDHEFFSIYPNTNTSQCIAEKREKGRLK